MTKVRMVLLRQNWRRRGELVDFFLDWVKFVDLSGPTLKEE